MTINQSKIDWCTHTWNPVSGCRNMKKHPFCYAEKLWNSRVKPLLVKKYGNKYDVPFSQITWRQENFEKTIPDDSYVFVNSMGEFYYWFRESNIVLSTREEFSHPVNVLDSFFNHVWKKVLETPNATFLLLSHHIDSFKVLQAYEKPANVRYGLSITDEIRPDGSVKSANKTLADVIHHIRTLKVDFLSLEPFHLTEAGTKGIIIPDDVRVVLGGLTPPNREYIEKHRESIVYLIQSLRTGENKIFIKDNLKCFKREEAEWNLSTVPPKATMAEKRAILREFWN